MTRVRLYSASTASLRAKGTGRALQNLGSASAFISSFAVIPLTVPRPGLKTLWRFWIVVLNWEASPYGRSVSDTRILQIFVQPSLIRDSQSLPKRDGLIPQQQEVGHRRSGLSTLGVQ